MTTGIASRPWLIVPICAAMHITYAIGYLFNPGVGEITALHLAHDLFGTAMWIVLLLIALIALAPMAIQVGAVGTHLCLWPQQFMLFLMTCSALQSSYLGVYPDGYHAPAVFILADQCYAVYLMLGHLAAIIRNARYR